METYSLLREIADSWVLLAMFCFFLGCVFWAFRPGSRALHDDAARSILKDDPATGCTKSCKDCACSNAFQEMVP